MTKFKLVKRNSKIDSREVAEMVGKNHGHLLRDIKGYCEALSQSTFGLGEFFQESTYLDGNGQTRPCYLITRKGCEMVANKMTGNKGVLFTATYVDMFHKMENELIERNLLSISEEFDKRIALLEDDRDRMRISRAQERTLQKAIASKVLQIVKGALFELVGEATYKRRLYPKIHRAVRDKFSVPSYCDVREKDFESALDFVRNWQEVL